MRGGAVVLLWLLAACDGPGVVGPNSVRLARAGSTPTATALVGTWRRAIFFLDDFGYSRSTETTFQFAADGSLVRVQIARNFTLGLVDVLVDAGRWRLNGSLVILDYATPTTFQVSLPFSVVGDQLDLAGQTFLRVVN